MNVITALVKAYDGGCVVVRDNDMDEGKWDEDEGMEKLMKS